MGGCSAPNCTNSSDNKDESKRRRVFRFPTEINRRQRWIQNCGRGDWIATNHSALCEDHFEKSQFELNRADFKKNLKPNAIPTIFNVPNPPKLLESQRLKDIGMPKDKLEKDMENYISWKLMGGKMMLKKGVLPHKFDCQDAALNRTQPKKKRFFPGRFCAVSGCTNKEETDNLGVSFHQFPKDAAQRAAWIAACGKKKGWRPTTRSALCSNHFSEDQLDREYHPLVLRDNAIPNVFTATQRRTKAAVPAAATSSSDPAETAFEPEVIIKEEPIDIVDETDAPSKSNEEFILGGLPSTIPSTTSGHTPTLGLAYSVADIKAEPTSPTVNGGRRTSKRTGGVLASEEKRQRDCDVVGETVSEPSPAKKDQFDAYGEYIAAKLRKLDWKSCAYVQKAIGDIMFEAEMGKFRNSVV